MYWLEIWSGRIADSGSEKVMIAVWGAMLEGAALISHLQVCSGSGFAGADLQHLSAFGARMAHTSPQTPDQQAIALTEALDMPESTAIAKVSLAAIEPNVPFLRALVLHAPICLTMFAT